MKKADAVNIILANTDVFVREPTRADGTRYKVKRLEHPIQKDFFDFYTNQLALLKRQLEAMPAAMLSKIASLESPKTSNEGLHIIIIEGDEKGISSKENHAIFQSIKLRSRSEHCIGFYHDGPFVDLDAENSIDARYEKKRAIITINSTIETSLKNYPPDSKIYNAGVIHELGHYYLDHCMPPTEEKQKIDALNEAIEKDKEHILPDVLESIKNPAVRTEKGSTIETSQEGFCRLLTQLCGGNYTEADANKKPYFDFKNCPHVCESIERGFPELQELLKHALAKTQVRSWQAAVRCRTGRTKTNP